MPSAAMKRTSAKLGRFGAIAHAIGHAPECDPADGPAEEHQAGEKAGVVPRRPLRPRRVRGDAEEVRHRDRRDEIEEQRVHEVETEPHPRGEDDQALIARELVVRGLGRTHALE
jgi:hypothetical protein